MKPEQKPKTYHITTFGCVMNTSDSERVAAVAESLGYSSTEDINSADIIVINSCSIRQKAEDRVVGMGKRIQELKVKNEELKVILTGCMAKRDERGKTSPLLKGDTGGSNNNSTAFGTSSSKRRNVNDVGAGLSSPGERTTPLRNNNLYHQSLKKLMPWLDHVIEIKDMHKLGEYLGIENEIKADEYLSVMPKTDKNISRYIPISTGCNKFCTFCIVPFARGKEIYRPITEILKEVDLALESGVKEIILLGQNVNSWRGWDTFTVGAGLSSPGERTSPLRNNGNISNTGENNYIESSDPHRLLKKEMPEGMLDFADLLDIIGENLDRMDKKIWLRFTSSHPYDIDEKLIDVINKHQSIAKQFHFALQSGSNTVLRRMNRHYTIEDFTQKCDLIREKILGVGISTDIIVGFCGETDKEFNETCDAINNLKFDQAFISEYSNRKGTVAARAYKDDVTNKVKSERKVVLNELLGKGNLERNMAMLDQELDVLIYKKSKKGFVGRTENGKDVVITPVGAGLSSPGENTSPLNTTIQIGEFIPVKITGFTDWSIEGEITK